MCVCGNNNVQRVAVESKFYIPLHIFLKSSLKMSNVDENVFYKQIIDLDNPIAKHDLVILWGEL